jgi:RNA polymerase sigma factor (TIGR02999 family)
MAPPRDVTALLLAWNTGDEHARSVLISVVYTELKSMARRRMRHEPSAQSLSATAVVHETYLRLIDQTRVQWQNRAQFFAIAAQLMRRVLVDAARARAALKRGAGHVDVRLDDSGLFAAELAARSTSEAIDVLALDRALQRLKESHPRHSALVELRFFGGLTVDEAAEALDVSRATVTREWTFARAWLYRELAGPPR